jgi:hypothetical protein
VRPITCLSALVDTVKNVATLKANVTIDNPAAIADLTTSGTVHLFVTRNNQEVLLLTTTDGGVSWPAKPRELPSLKEPTWNGVWPGTVRVFHHRFCCVRVSSIELRLLYGVRFRP